MASGALPPVRHRRELVLDRLEGELSRAHKLKVRYDSGTGVPTLIRADPVAMAADDEYSVYIADIRAPLK